DLVGRVLPGAIRVFWNEAPWLANADVRTTARELAARWDALLMQTPPDPVILRSRSLAGQVWDLWERWFHRALIPGQNPADPGTRETEERATQFFHREVQP